MESKKIPAHVFIIPDGNRRWASEKGLVKSMGHVRAGRYENMESLFKEAQRLGVKYVSIWGFSCENWKRSVNERKVIFDLVASELEKFRKQAGKNKMKFKHIGRKDRLPRELVEGLNELEEETKQYDSFNVQLFLDYGGRDEILRAVNEAIKEGKEVDEKSFSQLLDTGDLPDPDLIIRTSGERRTSGLMPWQAGYAEWCFVEKNFPDFTKKDLRKCVEDYARRKRRFGK